MVCDIEAVDISGRVSERLRGVSLAPVKTNVTVNLNEAIWDSVRDNPRQRKIRLLLEYGDRFILAHISISLLQGALEADEEGLLQEQLSEEEIERYRKLKHIKRRLEWLAGRIAAKGSVRMYLEAGAPPPSLIKIDSSPDNVPYVLLIEERHHN